MNFVMNHAPGTGSIDRPVGQQSSALPLYHGCLPLFKDIPIVRIYWQYKFLSVTVLSFQEISKYREPTEVVSLLQLCVVISHYIGYIDSLDILTLFSHSKKYRNIESLLNLFSLLQFCVVISRHIWYIDSLDILTLFSHSKKYRNIESLLSLLFHF